MANNRNETRTDSVQVKLCLLETAYSAGNHDLAMSLAESIKDSLTMLRQTEPDPGMPQSDAKQFIPVEQLPSAWAEWARGWSFCKPLALFETVGMARHREPVDLLVEFDSDQTRDLAREIRVARIDPINDELDEVVCQIYGQMQRGDRLFCRVMHSSHFGLSILHKGWKM